MPAGRWFKKLTPQMAWEQYVGETVTLFVSNFYSEGVTDVAEMCRIYASEIPWIFRQVVSTENLEHVAGLLERYIEEKGFDPSELYSEEELDRIWYRAVDELLALLGKTRKKRERD